MKISLINTLTWLKKNRYIYINKILVELDDKIYLIILWIKRRNLSDFNLLVHTNTKHFLKIRCLQHMQSNRNFYFYLQWVTIAKFYLFYFHFQNFFIWTYTQSDIIGPISTNKSIFNWTNFVTAIILNTNIVITQIGKL